VFQSLDRPRPGQARDHGAKRTEIRQSAGKGIEAYQSARKRLPDKGKRETDPITDPICR